MARINPKGLAAIAAAGLTVCSAGLYKFLGDHEGASEYVVYADKLANGIPTVCRGLTHWVTDTPIIVGEHWSPEKCEREEKQAIAAVQSNLIFCFGLDKKQIPQSVFDAATSHAWNFGYKATCSSQAMKAWIIPDWALGCRRLQYSDAGKMVWVYSAGKFVRGLAVRRGDERAYCEGIGQ